MDFEFGSLKEAIAILAYTRERNITFLSGVFPVVSDEKASDTVKQFRGLVFPEEALSDAKYLKDAKEMMKKLIQTEIRIKTVESKEEGNYKHV